MTDDLNPVFAPLRLRVEKALDAALSTTQAELDELTESMRYSALGGGKRIRAMLVYLSAQACSPKAIHSANPLLDASAAALELIHCYSLVHDDLPAMDDDDLRRGKPSCHIQFGEAMAILAGDALQAKAFELLASAAESSTNTQTADTLKLFTTLAKAAGATGMVGGQAIDIQSVEQSLNLSQLEHMHQLKTGALIAAATHMGALCVNAEGSQRTALISYGLAIGLAFQVQDDILDIEGDSSVTGKPQGADIAANKPTYPALLGIEGARNKASCLCDEAIAALSIFDSSADPLRALARYIIGRNA